MASVAPIIWAVRPPPIRTSRTPAMAAILRVFFFLAAASSSSVGSSSSSSSHSSSSSSHSSPSSSSSSSSYSSSSSISSVLSAIDTPRGRRPGMKAVAAHIYRGRRLAQNPRRQNHPMVEVVAIQRRAPRAP
ncbi:MAG TPA: hypothetical protein DC046_05425 [Rhodospirillaceae bacterium]|nr:hypothetical protein [Rhodospirillaceae bacterium]